MVTDIQLKVACACGRASDVVVAGVGMCNHCLDCNYEKLQQSRASAQGAARVACTPINYAPRAFDYNPRVVTTLPARKWQYIQATECEAYEAYDRLRDRDYDGMQDNAVRALEDQ